ncbi:MAG: hypothetical protein IJ801_09625 [Lachnospiraceae bacterium]|nr:hypothetical protein [Lachnospiraceae bacterium]
MHHTGGVCRCDGTVFTFVDEYDRTYTMEVIGAFSTADPFVTKKDILIPRQELLGYQEELLHTKKNLSFSRNKSYIIEVESYKYTDSMLEDVSRMTGAYRQQSCGELDPKRLKRNNKSRIFIV